MKSKIIDISRASPSCHASKSKIHAVRNLKKATKALYALAFSLMLLAGGYGTVLAQQKGGEAAPQTEEGDTQERMQNCPMMQQMMQMMQNCPMMKDGAMMEGGGMMGMMENCPMMKNGDMEQMQNCPMMEGMMQQDGMMEGGDAQGEQSSQTSRGTSAPQEHTPVRLATATTLSQADDKVQVVKITIDPDGYEPKQVELEAGLPARLIFTRTTDATCAKQIQAPDFGIERTELPLNEPVTIEFTPEEAGEFTFACGMDMMKGTIIVKS